MSYYSDGEKKSDILLIILLIFALITLFLISINNSKKIQSLEEEISTLKTIKQEEKQNDNTNIENNSTVKENNIYEIEENDNNNLTKKDKQVLEYLEDIDEKVNYLNNTEKSKAKGVFIGIVDFLFYDGKINGISFDELSDEGKKEVLKKSSNIDAKLDKDAKDISKFDQGSIVYIIGTVSKYEIGNKAKVNTLTLSNCFAE